MPQPPPLLGDGKGAKILDASNYVYDKTPSREDFHGSTDSWTEKLGTENKFSAGYKITGNITINRITVTTDVEYVKADFLGIEFDTDIPQAASLQIDSDIASTLKLEGNLSDRVKIAEIPVPIAATGLTVTVGLYLYADASGFVQVQAAIENTAKAEWEALAKLKHTADSNVETKAEAAIDIAFGADLSASLDAFGAIVIMDVGVKAGGELAADAYVDGKCEVKESDDTVGLGASGFGVSVSAVGAAGISVLSASTGFLLSVGAVSGSLLSDVGSKDVFSVSVAFSGSISTVVSVSSEVSVLLTEEEQSAISELSKISAFSALHPHIEARKMRTKPKHKILFFIAIRSFRLHCRKFSAI